MFKKYLLKDLLTIRNGKDYKTLNPGKVPLYGSGGVMGSVDNYIYDGESILLPRKGTLDNICYASGKFWTIDTMYWSVINTKIANPKYLYLYLSILDLSFQNSGSTLPSMTFDAYYSIPVYLPSKEEQDFIAESVFTLIEKIENNNRIITELESMAKLIYDYWFVQFDFPDENGRPYKSNGGKMVWNEELKREIPEGWEVKSLHDISTYTNGIACQKYRPAKGEESLPVIKIREMRDGITADTESVSSSIPDKVIVNKGDILFSWSASLAVILWSGEKAGLNQHIFKITPNKRMSKWWTFLHLRNFVVYFEQIANSRKTTMGHITLEHIKDSKTVVPKREIHQKYDLMVDGAFSYILQAETENQQLTSLRDFLLPLLMNGQVTIGEKAGENK